MLPKSIKSLTLKVKFDCFGRLFKSCKLQFCIVIVMKRIPLCFALLTLIAVVVLELTSCNVTRRVTTESSFYQRGDTTCTIVTKTIESYDASKKSL